MLPNRVVLCLFALSLTGCLSGLNEPRIDPAGLVIIAFGDSITKGVKDDDGTYACNATKCDVDECNCGYPPRLEVLLQNSLSSPDIVVINEGNPGETTVGGLERLPEVLEGGNSDYVLLLEGVNNIFNIQDGHIESELGAIIPKLEEMVKLVKASGATPLIATLTPTSGLVHGTFNPAIKKINPMIAELAAGEGIVLVDLHAAFFAAGYIDYNNDGGLLSDEDGLHPNGAGYDVIAQAWEDGVQEAMNRSAKTSSGL